MTDRGTAEFIPLGADTLITAYAPLMPGGGSTGPLIPTVGIIFPSGAPQG